MIDSVSKNNTGTYKTKDFNDEKITNSFWEIELFLSKLKMSYYPEPGSHVTDKVKVVLDVSNYATKKELDDATCVDISDLTAKKDFIALKIEVDKPDFRKLLNVSTSLNSLKTKVDNLDVGKLKTVPIELQKLSDPVDNKVVKNTKFNTLKTNVKTQKKKIPEGTTFLDINQYHTGKQHLEKKMEIFVKKYQTQVGQ